jgi:hypothetical protein
VVDCGYGVLAVNIAGFVREKGGVSCEAVGGEGQGGATVVAEEEPGRRIKGGNWDRSWKKFYFI